MIALATLGPVRRADEVDLPAGAGVGAEPEALRAALPDAGRPARVPLIECRLSFCRRASDRWSRRPGASPAPGCGACTRRAGAEPRANVASILPRWRFLRRLVITPASSRARIPSPNISVCTPRSFLSPSCCTTASGMAPMPICRVAPSGIISATYRPIASSTGPSGGWAARRAGRSTLHDRRHLRDVDVAVTEAERHLRVHLEDDGARAFDRCHRVVRREAEREVAVLVHRRGAGEDDVAGQQPAPEQLGHLGEVRGAVVDPPLTGAGAAGAPRKAELCRTCWVVSGSK
jgi:hypothetical protein